MTNFRRCCSAALVLTFLAGSATAANIDKEIAAVERIRGLKFKAPVKTVEIQRSELPDRLKAQIAKSLPYSVQEFGEILRSLRVIGDETDDAIVTMLLNIYQQQVLAYYDPGAKTFFTVKQGIDSPIQFDIDVLGAGVNVHELTHALQDQHFRIGDKDRALRNDSDANMALHAVVEGEASLVMLAYLIENGGGTLDEMLKNDTIINALATASQVSIVGPRYFVESLKFPYVDGLRFVIAAYRRGGWKELDRVYANPPQSSREILHPEEYLARTFKPVRFDAKPAVSAPHILSVEHLGEFHWQFLTGEGKGWVSDRVTLAQNQWCETTVLVETQWESEARARDFFDAYTSFLEDVGSVGKVNGKSVRVAYGADRRLMDQFVQQ